MYCDTKTLLDTMGESDYLASDLYSTINLINKLTCLADYNLMYRVIDLALKKDYMAYVELMLGSINNYDMLISKINKNQNEKSINLINSCFF